MLALAALIALEEGGRLGVQPVERLRLGARQLPERVTQAGQVGEK